jgi:TPR repeat protein
MKQLLVACLALLAVASAATAGPYEDGMAAYGRGDYAGAYGLLHQSAERGHANAQYNLGLMYEGGQGVAQDYVQAHKWFSLATAGATDMVLRLAATASTDRATEKMTRAQVAEAQKLAREWKPSKP